MEKSTQNNNFIKINTAYGYDTLILTSFELYESLSEPFKLTAKAYFNGIQSELNELLGKNATITLESSESGALDKTINGVVTSSEISSNNIRKSVSGEVYKIISITIEPKLSFLKYRTNSKIFQNKSVEDIVSEILSEHQIKFKLQNESSYPEYSYKVQYEETDFDFIHRILADEGVAYCFEHSASEHSLVFFDKESYFQPNQDYALFYEVGSQGKNQIYTWKENQTAVHASSTKCGFDMESPAKRVTNHETSSSPLFGVPRSEAFEYLAETETEDIHRNRNRCYLEALQKDGYVIAAETTCGSVSAGRLFKLEEHIDPARIGKEYLITTVFLKASVQTQIGTDEPGGNSTNVQFQAIDAGSMYRPTSRHKKPLIAGVQTALVTGNQDGEIYVDKHGRIKVQFHWDRVGNKDSNSSCWIRVAQSVAGNRWGSSFLPRVGQEVIVEFINGDPDQPIVTGALYNGSNGSPFTLPANKTQSGFKSRTVRGGSSECNEIRFEDKPEKEHVYLQAQKDYQEVIKNDSMSHVKNDRLEKVGNNKQEIVTKDSTLRVQQNYMIDVTKASSLKVGDVLEIKVGSASFKMDSGGNIELIGKNILIDGSDVTIKGSKIKLEAGKIDLN